MARIRVDTDEITGIHTIMNQQTQTMQNVEHIVSQVLVSLDMEIAATGDIKQSLTSLKTSSAKQQTTLSDMSSFLLYVNDEFISTDHKISEQARDVNYLISRLIGSNLVDIFFNQRDRLPIRVIASRDMLERLLAGVAAPVAMASPVNPLDPLSIVYGQVRETIGPHTADAKENIGAYASVGKVPKAGSEIFDWMEYLFDNEAFGDIADAIDEAGKKFYFQVAGYLSDAATVADILFADGDIDDIPGLLGKYAKKIAKGAIKAKSVAETASVVTGVYLDIAWHFGENANESIQTIREDPSVASVLYGAWHATGGAVIDTGVGLAEDLMSAAGVVSERMFGGVGFDSNDFHDAMDYLWGNPFFSDKRTAAGDIINIAADAGRIVIDGAIDVGGTIIDGAFDLGKNMLDGAAAAGEAAGKFVADGFNAVGGYIKGAASWLRWPF